jgi:putative transposase
MVSENRSKLLRQKDTTGWFLTKSALLDLLAQLKLTDGSDRIRVVTQKPHQELIDAEASVFIGAAPFQRTTERSTHRNGTRQRTLTTTAGDLELSIPQFRQGTFFPALLKRPHRGA